MIAPEIAEVFVKRDHLSEERQVGLLISPGNSCENNLRIIIGGDPPLQPN